ncbi:hypothetical protein P7K49_013528 [Saguinus oedipus]|uniref:Uncharacterized protein n=1 Tax=Saguinus oedipus TaxID=9490 RepID=A0ABQ9VG65_SAGOE|nr:hypothetical protein P7K49_013528 [Saguinus oedipus]
MVTIRTIIKFSKEELLTVVADAVDAVHHFLKRTWKECLHEERQLFSQSHKTAMDKKIRLYVTTPFTTNRVCVYHCKREHFFDHWGKK